MIIFSVTRGRLRVTGHAGAGEHGEDIVCAAVSTLAWTLVYGVRDVLGVPVEFPRSSAGDLEVVWDHATTGDQADLLIETVRGSVGVISARHPGRVTLE